MHTVICTDPACQAERAATPSNGVQSPFRLRIFAKSDLLPPNLTEIVRLAAYRERLIEPVHRGDDDGAVLELVGPEDALRRLWGVLEGRPGVGLLVLDKIEP